MLIGEPARREVCVTKRMTPQHRKGKNTLHNHAFPEVAMAQGNAGTEALFDAAKTAAAEPAMGLFGIVFGERIGRRFTGTLGVSTLDRLCAYGQERYTLNKNSIVDSLVSPYGADGSLAAQPERTTDVASC
jgi:hypothetical protein